MTEDKQEGSKPNLPPTSSKRQDELYVESARCLSYSCPQTDQCFQCFPRIGEAYQDALNWLIELPTAGESGTKPWKKGMCEDCSLGLILMVCCCPCIINSRTVAAVTGDSCENVCCWTWLTCCCSCCYLGHQRTLIRQKYDIKGSRWMDCLCTCLLYGILAQEAKEVVQQVPGYYVPMAPMTKAPQSEEMTK